MYTGDWRENKISGIGVYSWLDGRKYQGEWLDNNMEGMGIYIWNDGRQYRGQYKDDKKHGFGIYTWADQRCYEGYWYKGKQHGLYGHHGTWILGIGRTLSTAYAWYRAPAYSDKIVPADQWNAVRDYSREGKKTGDPAPEIKVSTNNCFTPQPILNSISLAFLVLTVINILC